VISSIMARLRSLWSGVTRGHTVDDEMQEEFRHHIELRAADLVRSGLSPADAERRARIEFGGTYTYKEEGRQARGLRWFDVLRVSTLDIKLGARMLARYPGLTLVGSVAMGVAIAIGAGVLGLVALLKDPSIPLDEGERIVGIQVWSVTTNNPERRILRDFALWRDELGAVQDVGAFRTVVRNVVSPDGRSESARAAAMTPSGFRVARVAPLLGRYLVDDDDRAGAPPVTVLGYELWRSRFGADSGIVGRQVQLGGVGHTVVGVMPERFAFPVSYELWVPLRLDPIAFKPRQGPPLFVFGRLAPSASLEEARVEVEALGARMSQQFPQTHERLAPRLLPFAQSWFELDSPETQLMFRAGQVAVTLLLVIICVNIAILVYARTATRQGEIAVRSALGASRFRIVAQLFGEALVFAGIGAAIGLALISVAVSQIGAILEQMDIRSVLPFWIDFRVSPATFGYLVALAVLAAAIIGALPALRLTGRKVQANLQRLSGGRSTIRMGRFWTSMIIAEVAMTVAILPIAVFYGSEALKAMTAAPGFAAEEYLSGTLWLDRDVSETEPTPTQERMFVLRFAAQREELFRRLRDESGIAAVTFSADVPGSESSTRIELDGAQAPSITTVGPETRSVRHGGDGQRVRYARVAADFLDVFEVPLVAGRTFGPADADTTSTAAVVNRAFVETLLQGRNAIGQQFRSLGVDENGEERRGPWQQIVGVVENFPAHVDFERPKAVWYSARGSGLLHPVTLAIRTPGSDPATFTVRVRATAGRVAPALHMRDVQPIDDALRATHLPLKLAALGLIAVTLSVLILAAAGLYSLMSVVVMQRRREIGIRIALGADRRRVLSSVFSRAAVQLISGVAVGVVIAAIITDAWSGEMAGFNRWVVLSGVALLMLAVGVVAALGPARRGLSIQPIMVLKED
jgi:putative ABC transport system permease protein